MVQDFNQLTPVGRLRRLRAMAWDVVADYPFEAVRLRAMTDSTNGIFRVDTSSGDRYVLRIGMAPPAGKTSERTLSELEWLADLAGRPEITVPSPIKNSSGSLVSSHSFPGIPEARTCCVFSWLEGPLLAERLSEDTMRAYGAAMARLHTASLDFAPSPTFVAPRYTSVYPFDAPFNLLKQAGPDILPPRRRTVYSEAIERIEDWFAALPDTGPIRMIHGDLHGWNAKILRGRVSIFDFEDQMWGWPVQDIGTAFYYLWGSDDFDRRCWWFREGYEGVAEWPDPKGREVPLMLVARSLLLGNDVLNQPEWMSEAPGVFERGERRISEMMAGRVIAA